MNQTTINTPQQSSSRSSSASPPANTLSGAGELQPLDDLVEYVTTYARQNPGTAAMWCFGVGFILGWRLKPW